MNSSNAFIPFKRKDRPLLLLLSLLLSLLLHLLVVLFLPFAELATDNLPPEQQKPTIVRLVEKPQQDKPKEYELDQRPAEPAEVPPPESSRLAEQNQQVEKEMAPRGEDTRDQAVKPARQPLQQKQRQAAQAAAKTSIQKNEPIQETSTPKRLSTDKGILPPQQLENLPSLKQLTKLPQDTLGRIAQNEQALQNKRKERNDLETGDTVWLNLERGLLISFFRRFRNQIEGVWNYPREAIEKEQQGTLLLKITVNTSGELVDVELLESSRSDILDYEAIQAVYRAAPFGPLGKHYPHPDLKIMAHFRYQISGKYIYGRPR